MRIEELESISNKILNKSETLIKNEKRRDIRNERVFHHMFSSYVYSHFSEKNVDIWESLLLIPEYPTQEKFRWKSIRKYFKLSDVENASKEGVGKGKAGQFDFAIRSDSELLPRIFIEFKGPKLYKPIDIVEVMLKLLSQDKSHLKVFVAIITSSKKDEEANCGAIENLKKGIEFSLKTLETLKKLTIENINDINLYLYVATIPDNRAAEKIFWGNIAKYEKELIGEQTS